MNNTYSDPGPRRRQTRTGDPTVDVVPGSERLTVNLNKACHIVGVSRAQLYRWLVDGQIVAVKSGTRTLIVMDSLRRHVASLPPATFRKAVNAG
jgi:excisionase family DNA binding protein